MLKQYKIFDNHNDIHRYKKMYIQFGYRSYTRLDRKQNNPFGLMFHNTLHKPKNKLLLCLPYNQ